MAFKSKKEKFAFWKGLQTGKKQRKTKKRSVARRVKLRKKPKAPTYDYSKWFDFDNRGRIKGSYTADGFFEPD